MIKEFASLSLVIVIGFVIWGAYEKSQWPIDYLSFPVQYEPLPQVDQSYKNHIVQKYFEHAQIITDKAALRYPEDLVVTNDGTIYTGLQDGTVAIVNSTGGISTLYKFNDTNGIYGIIMTKDQSTLYFVTELRGLISLDIATATPTYLLSELDGVKFAALNNLCIDQDNQIIYITDSTPISMRFSNKEVLLKHKKGRIISFDLKTQKAQTILHHLAFPNGIVYEKSTKSVIFSELNLHRIVRFFVDGPKKGQTQIILSNLFGFGDNLKLNEKGQLLIALPATRDSLIDYLNASPRLRKFLMYLPERLFVTLAEKRAGGIKIDTKTGQIIEYLLGAPAKTHFVTTVLQKNDKVYFSSLKSPTILVLDRTPKQNTDSSQTQQKEL